MKSLLSSVLAMMICLVLTSTYFIAYADKWIKTDDGYRYEYSNGEHAEVGFLTIGNDTYFIQNDGNRKTGWLSTKTAKYYFNNDGTMRKGWLKLKSGEYYLNPTTGKMTTGVTTIEGKKYTFNDDGKRMLTSAQEIEDFLTKNYGVVKTPVGNCKLSFGVLDNKSKRNVYDYLILVKYDVRFINDNTSEFSERTDAQILKIVSSFKDHMENIANDLIIYLPNQKITGYYSYSYYKYPYIREGFTVHVDYEWNNYGGNKGIYGNHPITTEISWITPSDSKRYITRYSSDIEFRNSESYINFKNSF